MDIIPRQEGESVLYKFRPLGDEVSVTRIEDVLLNHRFFAAAACSFNDPFECQFRMSFDATAQEKTSYAIKWLREREGLSASKAREQAAVRLGRMQRDGPARVSHLILNEIGMVCFVGTMASPLMWSHYANGHNGICLELSARTLGHAEFFGQASAVTYQDDLPVIDYFRDDPMEKVRKAVYTKSSVWSYEREHRLVVQKPQESRFFDFDPLLITGVYLGCRVSDEDCQRVVDWLKHRPGTPHLHRAERANDGYRLEFRPYP